MNSNTSTITFAFRRPRFPLICHVSGELFAAESAAALQRFLGRIDLGDEEEMQFIDASGESWMLLRDQMISAPEFFSEKMAQDRNYQPIQWEPLANERGWHYPERALANRRLDRIVLEIAPLLKEGNRGRG